MKLPRAIRRLVARASLCPLVALSGALPRVCELSLGEGMGRTSARCVCRSDQTHRWHAPSARVPRRCVQLLSARAQRLAQSKGCGQRSLWGGRAGPCIEACAGSGAVFCHQRLRFSRCARAPIEGCKGLHTSVLQQAARVDVSGGPRARGSASPPPHPESPRLRAGLDRPKQVVKLLRPEQVVKVLQVRTPLSLPLQPPSPHPDSPALPLMLSPPVAP